MHHMYWETAKTTAVHLILNGISKSVMFIGDIFENSKTYCTGYRIKRSRGCSDFSFRVNRAPPVAWLDYADLFNLTRLGSSGHNLIYAHVIGHVHQLIDCLVD